VEYGDERDPKNAGVPRKNRADEQHRKNQEAMFVIAGKNDPRVPVSESQQIADALKKSRGLRPGS